VSEYQYYEFLAVDRPLTDRQQDEVRALSTRARITATSFTNEYQWGNFRGHPRAMMERYYDAHLYLTNWGTHQVMLRLPAPLLDPAAVDPYCVGDQVTAWTSGEHVILDLTSQAEEEDWEEDVERSLSAIVGVRAELATGDLRPLYLAWLSAYGTWERDEDSFGYADEDEVEPPVSPGLGSLTAAQRALADFLRLDDDLLAVAAEASPAAHAAGPDQAALSAWIRGLPAKRKDALLLRVAGGDGARVRLELLATFRDANPITAAPQPGRTVAELLDAAAGRRRTREQQEAAFLAEQKARREREHVAARERHLDQLAQDVESAWVRVESFIGTKKPRDYDQAVDLLRDLQAVAYRADHMETFTKRFTRLREQHLSKPSLIKRFNNAGLIPD
jgi:hypothetical protein